MRTRTTPLLLGPVALVLALAPRTPALPSGAATAPWVGQDPAPTPPEPDDPAPDEPPPDDPPLSAHDACELLIRLEDRLRAHDTLGRGGEAELAALLALALDQARESEDLRHRVVLRLLDLSGFGVERRPNQAFFSGGQPRQLVRRGACESLEALLASDLGPATVQQLAGEVLVGRTHHPLARRRMALWFLERQREEAGRMAFLTLARDEQDPLRGDVLSAMARWPEEATDLYLVSLLGRPYDKTAGLHPATLVLDRVREVDQPLGPRASAALEERARSMLISTDWRQASRAIELCRGLRVERRVPLLIDALSAWQRRAEHGSGSRRISDDVVRELRSISGRSVGTNPRNWITWWMAVRQGRTPLDAGDAPGAEPRSAAEFFGLRPVTDRVTFIIDLSGSMEGRWRTEQHSRYQEAVDQVLAYLQAVGEDARFNVILFNDTPLRSTPHLVKADTETLTRARNSLLARTPGGGTLLRPAVELALRLDEHGNASAERLEADTIIVLCDGETNDGSAWVAPLLERVGPELRVRFHCVLIGSQGNGTLRELAERTGGDFVRVGG